MRRLFSLFPLALAARLLIVALTIGTAACGNDAGFTGQSNQKKTADATKAGGQGDTGKKAQIGRAHV